MSTHITPRSYYVAASTEDALSHIRGQRHDESSRVLVSSEAQHDDLIAALLVATDEMDYCEQDEQLTDVWGTIDGNQFRCHIAHG